MIGYVRLFEFVFGSGYWGGGGCHIYGGGRWQVTPKHAYALDPTKSESDDYATFPA